MKARITLCIVLVLVIALPLFARQNNRFTYTTGPILTTECGGAVGIPTNSSSPNDPWQGQIYIYRDMNLNGIERTLSDPAWTTYNPGDAIGADFPWFPVGTLQGQANFNNKPFPATSEAGHFSFTSNWVINGNTSAANMRTIFFVITYESGTTGKIVWISDVMVIPDGVTGSSVTTIPLENYATWHCMTVGPPCVQSVDITFSCRGTAPSECVMICPQAAPLMICVGPIRNQYYRPLISVTSGCSHSNTACNDTCLGAQGFYFDDYSWVWTVLPWGNFYCSQIRWGTGPNVGGCVCIRGEYHLLRFDDFDWCLPVSLTTFSASSSADGIRLNFVLASETDNDHFEIWRSGEQTGEYAKIAEIASQGNSATGHSYDYVDRNVTAGRTYWYYLVDVDAQGNRTEHRDFLRSAQAGTTSLLPSDFAITAYPNPFNPVTTIAFSLPETGRAKVSVFSVTGQMVKILADEKFSAGEHRMVFDGAALPAGVYFVRLGSANRVFTEKVLLLK